MKSHYDFTRRARKTAPTIPADAVLIEFDPEVSELFDGPGTLTDRVRAMAAKSRRKGATGRIVRTIALSPREHAALRPLLDRLGGRCVSGSPEGQKPRRKAG